MTFNNFNHREVDAGFATPCHEPVRRDGQPYRRNHEGYVRFLPVVNGKRVAMLAHRLRYEAAHGESPTVTDHLCRNRWCCNPDHLESVDNAVNVRRGDCAKVTEGEVALIRVLYAEGGITQTALGKEFGLSQSHVSNIVNGMYWSDGPCKHWQQRKEARFV